MTEPSAALQENERLLALESLKILDTLSESKFDDFTKVAAVITQAPIVLISLIDSNRQWFKSKIGLCESETPRNISFCGHAILQSEPLIIEDALQDERFFDNPLVTGDPHIRFYAGFPIRVFDQFNIGTLCIIDHKPRSLSEEQKDALKILAAQLSQAFHERKQLFDAEELKRSSIAASKAKSEFLTAISHEIRAPLTAIQGFSEFGVKSAKLGETKKLEHYFGTIERNSKHILRVINDLLDVSKVEAGQFGVEKIDFNLSELLADIASVYSFKARKKGIKFLNTIKCETRGMFIGDPTRLRQILVNMLTNALKFTSAGEIELLVTKESGHFVFQVRDTGCGISEAQRNALFKPYAQADTSIARLYGGTGLGLYLNTELAKLLDGRFELVQSTLGVGSIFQVSLPIAESENILQGGGEPIPTSCQSSDFKKRILVVDDSPDNLDLLKEYLESIGSAVVTAENGMRAIEIAQNESFDLILCDIQMPGMDGFQTLRQLREIHATVKAVALTAHANSEWHRKFIEAGFSDSLAKPIDFKRLHSILV